MSGPNIDDLAQRCERFARARGWHDTPWEHYAYLPLEVSELIEALRNKGARDRVEEAADVLFVLLSTLHAHGVKTSDVDVAALEAWSRP